MFVDIDRVPNHFAEGFRPRRDDHWLHNQFASLVAGRAGRPRSASEKPPEHPATPPKKEKKKPKKSRPFSSLQDFFTGVSASEREFRQYQDQVAEINALEEEYKKLSNEQLKAKTAEFRQKIADGESLDNLLVEAFATVREASSRAIGMRHYDVQLITGMILHQGKVAEMRTGEGKTLSAVLALYLNALEGKGAHLITPSDYLSALGAQIMGPIFAMLGMSVGVIQGLKNTEGSVSGIGQSYLFDDASNQDGDYPNLKPVDRKQAYLADVTYGTINEFGFDYLRDTTAKKLSSKVQRLNKPHHYAIADEIDSILIDQATNSLILSDSSESLESDFFIFANRLAEEMSLDVDYEIVGRQDQQTIKITEDGIDRIIAGIGNNLQLIALAQSRGFITGSTPFSEPELPDSDDFSRHSWILPYVNNALEAKELYERQVHYYVTADGNLVLVSQSTGRSMFGSTYSAGLQQALQAKEKLTISDLSRTTASISLQKYLSFYRKLAGMTGTADFPVVREELWQVYNLDVVPVPTRTEYLAKIGTLQPCQLTLKELREILPAFNFISLESDQNQLVTIFLSQSGMDLIASGKSGQIKIGQDCFFSPLELPIGAYDDEDQKYQAIAKEALAMQEKRRPVLIGTSSIEESVRLFNFIKAQSLNRSVKLQLLNAETAEEEAKIISQAGASGTITVASAIAGRGVDILLGGNPEDIAREKLRQRNFSVKKINAIAWNLAVKLIESGQQKTEIEAQLTTRFAGEKHDQWLPTLYKTIIDCQEDRQLVRSLGGLHVIGTQFQGGRIDRQFTGRTSRQGDPGSSRFYICPTDKLCAHGNINLRSGFLLAEIIKDFQTRVEGNNLDIRMRNLRFQRMIDATHQHFLAHREQVLRFTDTELESFIVQKIKTYFNALFVQFSKKNENFFSLSDQEKKTELIQFVTEIGTLLALTVDESERLLGSLIKCSNLGQCTALLNHFVVDRYKKQLTIYAKQVVESYIGSFTLWGELKNSLSKSGGNSQHLSNLISLMEGTDPFMGTDSFNLSFHQSLAKYRDGDGYQLKSDTKLEEIQEPMKQAVGYLIKQTMRTHVLLLFDQAWLMFLNQAEELRESIGLRAIGARSPVDEFVIEADRWYRLLTTAIDLATGHNYFTHFFPMLRGRLGASINFFNQSITPDIMQLASEQ